MSKSSPLTVLAEKVQILLRSRYGLWGMGFISFLESALPVPLITDPFMAIYILANQKKAVQAVLVTTFTSVAGGLLAYYAAYFVRDPILAYFSPEFVAEFNKIALEAQTETFALTILGAVTPIPYTAVAMAIGLSAGNVWIFIFASLLGRGARYSIVGYLTYKLGAMASGKVKQALFYLSVTTVLALCIYLVFSLLF